MTYLYTDNRNFADYASGRVFYAQAGQPAFPVRLASEIFQRALKHWDPAGEKGRVQLYDPVCGGAYWLTALAYLHWDMIDSISASDVDDSVLPLAERNLSLLTNSGLNRRIAEIENMREEFGKKSHAAAGESARLFRQQLAYNLKTHAIHTHVFQADATDLESLRLGLGNQWVDLVLADVPYGWQSAWRVIDQEWDQPPVECMLAALHPTLNSSSVVAVAADKTQKIHPENYRRLERFQMGKRRIEFLKPESHE